MAYLSHTYYISIPPMVCDFVDENHLLHALRFRLYIRWQGIDNDRNVVIEVEQLMKPKPPRYGRWWSTMMIKKL